MRWGCLRAANLFFSCRRVEPARLALADVRARVDSEALLPHVTAMEAAFAFFSGDVRTALDLGFAVCTSDVQPVVRMWARRVVSTRVLPVPAPARTSTGPSVATTAARCSGFNPASGSGP